MKFRIIITGLGGQGIISLAKIIAKAAFFEGYDVKMSELHGLSQRMGHASCHVIFGDKVFSSLIKKGDADLIISLEPLEALRVMQFASKKTSLVLNDYPIIPISVYSDKKEYPSKEFIEKNLEAVFKQVFSINASEKVREENAGIASTNIFMLGYAFSKNIIPLKRESLIKAMKETILKNQEINENIFNLSN